MQPADQPGGQVGGRYRGCDLPEGDFGAASGGTRASVSGDTRPASVPPRSVTWNTFWRQCAAIPVKAAS